MSSEQQTTLNKRKFSTSNHKFTFFAVFFAFVLTIIPDLSFAQAGTNLNLDNLDGSTDNAFSGVSRVACKMASFFNGPIARSVATFGLLFLGFGAFLGKLNWGVVLTTAFAIFIIFGASKIIETIADDSNAAAGESTLRNCVGDKNN